MNRGIFDRYLLDWKLLPDGEPVFTHSSSLLPVRRGRDKAMIKIATAPGEKMGANLMEWWNGDGAAQVLERRGEAILIERATGRRSLSEMAEGGHDDEASAIICSAVARLHRQRSSPVPPLFPLKEWFRDLLEGPREGILAECAEAAEFVLAEPRDVVPLHGDIHHANILDFGSRGWLAIDPKGLIGERGFDYANLFCNPDHPVATAPGRLHRQVAIVATEAALDEMRLLYWIFAWTGLSATWLIQDKLDQHVAPTLEVAGLAANAIGRRT